LRDFTGSQTTVTREDGTTYLSETFYVVGYKQKRGRIRLEWDAIWAETKHDKKWTDFKIKYRKDS
jgi:hypothetical protein